jgi:hypothetical protein
MRIAALLAFAACGASTSPPAPTSTAPASDAGIPADAAAMIELPDAALRPDVAVVVPVTTCATTFAEMKPRASCTGAEQKTCAFVEGTCVCAGQSYCGGIPPSRELLDELAKPVWQCKAARTDGCPEQQPTGKCKTPGKVCGYGDCCRQAVTCTKGTWIPGAASCPP